MINYPIPEIFNGLLNLYWVALPIMLIMVFWWMYYSYPLFLDKLIKKGKTWLYLPANWTSKRKKILLLINRLLKLFFSIGMGISFEYALSLQVLGFTTGFIIGLFLAYFIENKIFEYRYMQQRRLYLRFYNLVVRMYEQEGKAHNESEMNNRAQFDFQTFLRAADAENNLLKQIHNKLMGN